MSNKAGMGTYLVSAIASAWSGMTVMNLSEDNQARHLAAILFAIAVVLVIIGVAVNVKRAMDAGCETKSDEPKSPTPLQPHEDTLQTPILPMSADRAEKSVLQAIRRKITEYQDMGDIGFWRSRLYGEGDSLVSYELELNAVRKNLKDVGCCEDGEYQICVSSQSYGKSEYLSKARNRHYSAYFNEKCNLIIKKSLQVGLSKSQAEVIVLSDYMLEELGIRLSREYIALKLKEVELRYHMARIKEEQKQKEIEERKAQKDYERAMRDAAKNEEKAREQLEMQREALGRAASEAEKTKLQEQVSALEVRLQEALAMKERAMSMAQQTRTGYVYVISNVRSFGEGIYKIGMTRRLDPMDRVRELGDASVPFPFEVHYMIYTDDAPKLEAELHQRFAEFKMNSDNYRKEFFKVPIEDIESVLKELEVI
jgi:hypothetical protein